MGSPLKAQISDDMKAAMRGGDRLRLGTIRMLKAAIQQREVDERRELGEAEVLQIIEKLLKQRREAAEQFASAGRTDLEGKELDEARVLSAYLPEPLSESELESLLEQAIRDSAASGVKDMGRVMNALRPKIQGRADMSHVSSLVKTRLAG